LHIIRELMTSVDVASGPERPGTRLEMRKSMRRAPPLAPVGGHELGDQELSEK
jgi:hypothetical protein